MFKIVIIGIAGTILAVLLSDYRKDMALLVGLATGAAIFLCVADLLSQSFISLFGLLKTAKVDFPHLDIALKIIGIGYLAKFGAQICRDAGQGAIAMKVELAAKITIVFLSLPILKALLELVMKILP